MKNEPFKTIYLIEGNFGSWDLHHTSIIKAFYNKEDADEYKERIERIFFKYQKIIATRFEKADKYLERQGEKDFSFDFDIYDKLEEEANAHFFINDFNGCDIKLIKIT